LDHRLPKTVIAREGEESLPRVSQTSTLIYHGIVAAASNAVSSGSDCWNGIVFWTRRRWSYTRHTSLTASVYGIRYFTVNGIFRYRV